MYTNSLKKYLFYGLLMLLALAQVSLMSCNQTGKTTTDATDTTYGTESKDSADNLNRTKFNGDPLMKQTAQYISGLYLNGLYSVTLSQKALKHPLHDTTENIARYLIEKHQELNKALKQIANTLTISIPAHISNTQQQEINELEEQKGIDFESGYINKMIHLHKDTYTTLLKTRESSNEQLRNWSKQNIPVFEALDDRLSTGRDYLDSLQIKSGGSY